MRGVGVAHGADHGKARVLRQHLERIGLREHLEAGDYADFGAACNGIGGDRDIRLKPGGSEHPHALHRDVVGTHTDGYLAIDEGRALGGDIDHSRSAGG